MLSDLFRRLLLLYQLRQVAGHLYQFGFGGMLGQIIDLLQYARRKITHFIVFRRILYPAINHRTGIIHADIIDQLPTEE